MKRSPGAARTLIAACALLASGLPALSADRWQEAGAGAVAILPAPKPATTILGGSLYCTQQSWAFLFRLAPDAGLAPGTIEKAKLAVADSAFELDAEISAQAVKVGAPRAILLALREGSVLEVEIGVAKGAPKTNFNLRFSKQVIDAIEPRCSQIDMSDYEAVSLSSDDPAVPQATGLLAAEIKLFRNFTFINPVVSAVVLDFAGDKRLMFASLCGSKSYFGDSGCSLTGYAAEGGESIWKEVYQTEGVLLYTDPSQAAEGWPNLVTLPPVGGTAPTHWAWNGASYQVVDQIISGEDATPEQGDTSAQ